MEIKKVISTTLDLITSERCDLCHCAGIQCEFRNYSQVRIVHIDYTHQFPLPPEEFNCELKNDPFLTELDTEKNSERLRILREELKRQT